jgi:hypothetical protein
MYSNGKRLYHPRSIVTDHYLLDSEGVLIPDSLSPANNSSKLQASSLTAGVGYDRIHLERNNYEQ